MPIYGWMGKILNIELTTKEISILETMSFIPDYIGGRALASRIAWENIPVGIDAFDPENCIIITTGPLTGTLAPTSGRTVMSSVSPRTYPMNWYSHSTIGGWFGPELKYAGYDAIVLRGKATSPIYLEIVDGKASLVDAISLWGLDTRETQIILKEQLGSKTQILTIGPAGESLIRFATVQHAEENAAGHSGFGGVWGSKNLKAIAVKGGSGIQIADPEALLKEVLNAGTGKTTPSIAVTFEGGTNWFRDDEPDGSEEELKTNQALESSDDDDLGPTCSQACTFNCIVGSYARKSDGRRIPAFCIGADWQKDILMGATKYSGGGIEVPAGVSFDHFSEVNLHELCNTLGIDLWFRLVMQPWFIRCQELGVTEIKGYPIKPDDLTWFQNFVYQLAHREGLGDLFAEDLCRVMDHLEEELPEELIMLGRELEFNFGFPAHREGRFFDEEPLPFWVISAMMHISESRDPTIGSHLSSLLHAEFFITDSDLSRRQFRHLSNTVFAYPDAFEPTFENKAPVAIWSQNQHMIIDSLPLCDFAFPQLVRPLENRAEWESSEDILGDLDLPRRLLAAVTGIDLTDAEFMHIAERAFTLERIMLAQSGRGRRMEETLAPHFNLPCRADGTLIEIEAFYGLMDEYYSERGWDLEFGWPTEETLHGLDLSDVIPTLKDIRQLHDQAKRRTTSH